MLSKLRKLLVSNEDNRHIWVQEKLSEIQEGSKILDAGCGTQLYRPYCYHLNYYAQDFGEYKSDGQGLQIKNFEYGKLNYVGNVWKIDEKDAYFDVILCTEVLEHIPYPNETVKEFSRLLKSGGILILTAPFASLPHMEPYYFYSGFSKEWYRYNLEKNDFIVKEIFCNGNFHKYILQENLRAVSMLKNPLMLVIYGLFSLPKIIFDLLLSKFIENHQLLFGFHVLAVKK
jgi:SAM-dependent methyltransferase